MRILRTLALAATAVTSVVFVIVCAPLLAAMRVDRDERNRLEALARERWPDVPALPYDDDDPGVDVDEPDQHELTPYRRRLLGLDCREDCIGRCAGCTR